MDEREIEVRSLTGESIRVSIEVNKTVQDLKLLLRRSFPPASYSPSFHLFLKGAKLSLKSQISDCLVGAGEFLVVIPFVTKDKQRRHGVEASETSSEDPNPKQKIEKELSESAWCELMEDLSSYQHISENKIAHDRTNSSRTPKPKKDLNNDKEKGSSYDVILRVLQASGDNLFDEQIVKKFIEFIDCSSCLSNPATGFCVMRETNALPVSELDACNSTLCLCPQWLKDIMRAFVFINVYSACLQLWQKKITINTLKRPLDQLHKIGFRPGIADLELLSQLCPQFENGVHVSKPFSLEDLLVFVKNAHTTAAEMKVKRERRRHSDASSSHSYELQCHDTKSLLPEEMVEHLRSTVGTQWQVVHIEKISARNPTYVEIPCQLSENVKSALNRVGINRLYSHQAESIQASLAGKNVIVATMTSSGKSLCYNIPVLEVLVNNPLACALYLFPTKALAQDQLRALLAITHGLDNSLNIGIYDGDTSQEDRMWLRDNARLLITRGHLVVMLL